MKAGQLKKVANVYARFLQAPWRRVGNEFMRCEQNWVQIVAFNASRFSEQYVPRSCFEYLLIPGPATGTFVVQELQHANGTQKWISAQDVSTGVDAVFAEMERQFRPSITRPLDTREIKQLLEAGTDYWPHAYALCVMALESSQRDEAEHHFTSFCVAIEDKPYSWADVRKEELASLMAVRSDELASRLQVLREEKLRGLKLGEIY